MSPEALIFNEIVSPSSADVHAPRPHGDPAEWNPIPNANTYQNHCMGKAL
jgi:hypothetical protein